MSHANPAPVAVVLFSGLLLLTLWECGGVPRKYVNMAEPGATLTKVITRPEDYCGKVVLLGGVMVAEEEQGRDH